MKPVRTHKFNGVSYDIKIYDLKKERIDGLCDSPKGSGSVLRVFADMDTRKGLETCIHEALHACFWAKTEDKVGQTAKDIARLLWRLGYRLEKSKK